MRPAMPAFFANRTKRLAGAGIVALHALLVLAIHSNDVHVPQHGATVVYTKLLFPPALARMPPAAQPLPAAQEVRGQAWPRPRAAHSRTPATPPVAAATLTTPAAPAPASVVPATATAAETWEPPQPARGKLDIGALVAAAGENERTRPKEPLERVRDSQRVRGGMDDNPAARAIARTGRDDCTKKYSGGPNLDPLRLIPLLYDTITDTGCKW